MKVEKISVTVSYKVELSDLEMPDDVFEELVLASEKGIALDIHNLEYPKAANWICDNIEERDAYEWEVEIDNDLLSDDNSN